MMKSSFQVFFSHEKLIAQFQISSLMKFIPVLCIAFTVLNIVHSPEHVAYKIKGLAINLMKIKDYQGAWQLLDLAKKMFPALEHLDDMLFVCHLLRTADVRKPDYGVNWHQILCLPSSAHISNIEAQFKCFLANLESIKGEFPGTEIAQGLMKNAMLDFYKRERDKHDNFQTDVQGMESANSAAKIASSGDLKRKLTVRHCSNGRVSRRPSSVKQCETLDNAEVDLKKLVSDRKWQNVDDQCQLTESEELNYKMGIVEYDNQISETSGSKVVVEEKDDGGSRCESKNSDGEYWLVNSGRQVIKPLCKELSLHPNLKGRLFETMPQSPHYSTLNCTSEEFRRSIIMGIETSIVVVAEQIHRLVFAEDVRCNMVNISNQLIYLESMGYSVHKLRARLEELSRLAGMKQALLEAFQKSDNELKAWQDQIEVFEAKNSMINLLIAERKRELRSLEESWAVKESVIKFKKAKEAEIERQRDKRREECSWLDSEIECTAKLPW